MRRSSPPRGSDDNHDREPPAPAAGHRPRTLAIESARAAEPPIGVPPSAADLEAQAASDAWIFQAMNAAMRPDEHEMPGEPHPASPRLGARTARRHETPAGYAERHGGGEKEAPAAPSLFRAIRSSSTTKTRAASSRHTEPTIEAPPDGNLFPPGPRAPVGEKEAPRGGGRAEQRGGYLHLAQWDPQHDITAVDPTADEPVIMHVAGDKIATQYMSCTKDFTRACMVSAFDWNGAGGFGGLRSPCWWGPVIEIDVSRLRPDSVRIYDLSAAGPHRAELFAEMPAGFDASQPRGEIHDMSDRDDEVLIEGTIPGSAVVRVHSVVAVMQHLAATQDTFLKRLHDRVVTDRHERQDGPATPIENEQNLALITEAKLLDEVLHAYDEPRRPAPEGPSRWDLLDDAELATPQAPMDDATDEEVAARLLERATERKRQREEQAKKKKPDAPAGRKRPHYL